VIDKNGKLVGLVPVRDLILARGNRRISEIMERDFLSVGVTMDQEEVANFARKYDLVSVPVVDENNKLLGRITIDDIVDVMEEEATEDIHKMAGLVDEEEVREKAILRIVRARIPWLVWGLMGGLISAAVMINFESNLKEKIVLAYFVPVIMAMAGNIGIQSSALVVRGLATGEIAAQDYLSRCGKEMGISLLNGIILSSLLFAVVAIGWHNQDEHSLQLALLISLALVMVILIAGILGSTIPLVLKKFNIDPALATGPFITTSNDIIGLFIYLSIATQMLK
ncbi:MAG: magnesium transporter, partial [bacterium]